MFLYLSLIKTCLTNAGNTYTSLYLHCPAFPPPACRHTSVNSWLWLWGLDYKQVRSFLALSMGNVKSSSISEEDLTFVLRNTNYSEDEIQVGVPSMNKNSIGPFPIFRIGTEDLSRTLQVARCPRMRLCPCISHYFQAGMLISSWRMYSEHSALTRVIILTSGSSCWHCIMRDGSGMLDSAILRT